MLVSVCDFVRKPSVLVELAFPVQVIGISLVWRPSRPSDKIRVMVSRRSKLLHKHVANVTQD